MTPELNVPGDVRRSLQEFVDEIVRLYGQDLVSITVFGSAVAGGYTEAGSDVNLLVVYSDLNIADLNAVSKLAQRARKKRHLAPRFLSLRNLSGSVRYFQVDFLEMRDAHVVLYGRDVLADVALHPADLHWQIAHEVKRMRMRLKQQFWMAAGDERLTRAIVLRRFTSLVHLMRASLLLAGMEAPLAPAAIVDHAAAIMSIDREFAHKLLAVKQGQAQLPNDELLNAFTALMDLVRAVDEHNDKAAV